MSNDFAAGASSARYKLASFLQRNGISVETSSFGSPPTDDDFFETILRLVKTDQSAAAIVIIPFDRAVFKIPVTKVVLEFLRSNPNQKQILSTVNWKRDFGGYDHEFHLAMDKSTDEVQVYHLTWRGHRSDKTDYASGELESKATILYPGEHG
jgi:hypothetical protein